MDSMYVAGEGALYIYFCFFLDKKYKVKETFSFLYYATVMLFFFLFVNLHCV